MQKVARQYKSVRARAWRNLMVSGINAALERGLASLEYNENHDQPQHVNFEFTLPNGLRCCGYVNDAGHGELAFAVCVNLKEGRTPAMNSSLKSCDAAASGWLERKDGQWIQYQGSGHGYFRCRRETLEQLADLEVEPIGYSDSGRFFL